MTAVARERLLIVGALLIVALGQMANGAFAWGWAP
jgi:hypothetical protein